MYDTGIKRIRTHGGSKIVRVTDECGRYDLDAGDEIFVLTSPVRDSEDILSALRGTMFFVAAYEGGKVSYEVRSAVSERSLAESADPALIAVLGPFGSMEEARDFKLFLEAESPERSEAVLKGCLRRYLGRE